MNMNIDVMLLVLVILGALWAVMGRSLLKATIALAVTSALVSLVIFRLNSPLAAVFELSVCAGLITAIFVSAISMMRPLTHQEVLAISKARVKRYRYLPVVLVIIGIALMLMKARQDFMMMPPPPFNTDVRSLLWNLRRLDLIGQVVILIAGALGIVILFEEKKQNDK